MFHAVNNTDKMFVTSHVVMVMAHAVILFTSSDASISQMGMFLWLISVRWIGPDSSFDGKGQSLFFRWRHVCKLWRHMTSQGDKLSCVKQLGKQKCDIDCNWQRTTVT
jgi:hypothetical protein